MKQKLTQKQQNKKCHLPSLEDDFNKIATAATKQIEQKLKAAEKEIKAAVKISEKYGVPFTSSVSLIINYYRPASFKKKWKDLSKLENYEEICDYWKFGVEPEEGREIGWFYSDAC